MVGFLHSANILFDNTKDQTVGNGDWIIDDNQPTPLPLALNLESDWSGAFSSWGYILYEEGHNVMTLPPSEEISFGNPNNQHDLSNFDLFVMADPENNFTIDEINAMLAFVEQGGGLFLIGDAVYTDRNNNGEDSPDIWNRFGIENYFGMKFITSGLYASYSGDFIYGNFSHQILENNEYGNITSISFYVGATMDIFPENNDTVEPLFWARQIDVGTNNKVLAACCSYGSGKVVAVGDVELIDDGTGSSADDVLTNGWNKTNVTNKAFILSATKWLINEIHLSDNDLSILDEMCSQY